MAAAAPWSVKGIDPKAREVAKELARRSGMTLGEWLNRIILEDDMPEDIASEDQFPARPSRSTTDIASPTVLSSGPIEESDYTAHSETGRIATALDRLTDRIEASETRTGLAISGIEHSVRYAVARIETAEREHVGIATRFDAAAERLEAEQARASERLKRIEFEGPRSTEALRAIEARLVDVERAPDPAVLIEDVVERLGGRLAAAEARTGEALESLRESLVDLDGRLQGEGDDRAKLEQRLEGLAEQLTRRVEDARAEMAEQLIAATAQDVEARLERMTQDLAAAEQRSARAIETMGREVLSMAETLNRRVRSAEQRSADAIEQVGGEIARIADAVETRLSRTDQLHAEALERLGGEIGKITERLTDRIIQSERRAAQAIDDVGEQVAKVTERMEQRHERAASDIAERLRASEARAAQLLAEAGSRHEATADLMAQVSQSASVGAEKPASIEPPPAESAADATGEAQAPRISLSLESRGPTLTSAIFGPALFSRAEPVTQPALDPTNPTFGAEDFEAADGFIPIAESASDRLGEDPVETSSEAKSEEPQPSTREVIERARAAARAAASTRSPKIQANDRRQRPSRGGLFDRFKPGRSKSTWQTALMVAGGAAFLSVGAAGVVLMENPGATHEAAPTLIQPRASLALSQIQAPAHLDTTAKAISAPATAQGSVADDYVNTARGIEQEKPGALAHMRAIADGGYAPAQLFLAHLYEAGKSGVTLNLTEARQWTGRAAEAGDPSAMHNLALYYFRGEGGPQDAVAAARWFKQAAERGVVDSQYNLGMLYASGSGLPKDPAQAYKWFSIAANAGDPEARSAAVQLEPKLSTPQLAALAHEIISFQPTRAGASPEATAAGPSLIDSQKILARLGYYKGGADGANSQSFQLAVTAYQRDQGLAATGSLDPATVSRLAVFNR